MTKRAIIAPSIRPKTEANQDPATYGHQDGYTAIFWHTPNHRYSYTVRQDRTRPTLRDCRNMALSWLAEYGFSTDQIHHVDREPHYNEVF